MLEPVSRAEIQKARLLALILPAAERLEIERRYGVRPAALSALFSFFEILLGIVVYGSAHPAIGGAVGWVLWHLNPVAWLGLLIFVTGLLRAVSYFANHDSYGEPLVWLFLRLYQWKKGVDRGRWIDERFGPERPDRVAIDPDGTIVLLASRIKPDWDEYRTVRIEDRFFKIAAVEERPGRPHADVAYVLEEVAESEPLRGIVHTGAGLPPGV